MHACHICPGTWRTLVVRRAGAHEWRRRRPHGAARLGGACVGARGAAARSREDGAFQGECGAGGECGDDAARARGRAGEAERAAGAAESPLSSYRPCNLRTAILPAESSARCDAIIRAQARPGVSVELSDLEYADLMDTAHSASNPAGAQLFLLDQVDWLRRHLRRCCRCRRRDASPIIAAASCLPSTSQRSRLRSDCTALPAWSAHTLLVRKASTCLCISCWLCRSAMSCASPSLRWASS